MADLCRYYPPLDPREGGLSSRFGERCSVAARAAGQGCVPKWHAGIDLWIGDKPAGSVPVFAVAAGYVQTIARDVPGPGAFSGYGNCVSLRHVGADEGWWSFYAHMHALPAYLEELRTRDVLVPAGTVIGSVGKTSNGKFPHLYQHLHMEVRRAARGGGSPFPGPYRTYNVDPEPWLAERGIVFGYRGAIQLTLPIACLPNMKASDERLRAALRT